MGNLFTLLAICLVLGISMIIGTTGKPPSAPQEKKIISNIPNIGSIEILNGCGIEGAANRVADFLRSKNYDVKNIGNADTWNYPYTLVISRIQDTTVASQISKSLNTDKMVLIRNIEKLYDVTVFVGPDFGERIQ